MSYEAGNVKSTAVIWIWAGEAACHAEVIPNVTVLEKRVARRAEGSMLAQGLIWWDAKNVGSSNDVDGCDNWTKLHPRKTSAFSDSKIVFALVKAKTEMKLPNVVESCSEEAELVVNPNRLVVVKHKIRGNESNRLVGPLASVRRVGNTGMALAGDLGPTSAGLAMFGHARSSKDTEMKPVADGALGDEKDESDA